MKNSIVDLKLVNFLYIKHASDQNLRVHTYFLLINYKKYY